MSKDQEILRELIGKKILVADFEKEICKIMKKRSTSRLWCSNIPDSIRDINGELHTVNYRCIPESPKCENMFCLVLEHENGMVVVKEGYLEKL